MTDPTEENDAARKTAMLKQMVDDLRMHFDTVQIFVSEHVNDEVGTIRQQYGGGNFLARYGHVKLWIKREEAAEADMIHEKNEE